MISQPMNGLEEKEIRRAHDRARAFLELCDFEVVDSFIEEKSKARNQGLWYLSKSLEAMSDCDAVYFMKGWNESRGCIIEHKAAREYGLSLLYEDPSDEMGSIRNRDVIITATIFATIVVFLFLVYVLRIDTHLAGLGCTVIMGGLFFISWTVEIFWRKYQHFMNTKFSRR